MIWLASLIIVIIGGFYVAMFVLAVTAVMINSAIPKPKQKIVYVGDPDSCVSKVGPIE